MSSGSDSRNGRASQGSAPTNDDHPTYQQPTTPLTTMRREIAIILVALELLLSISFLSASAYLFVQARHFSPFAELTKAQTLLRQYADAADAKRDNLDRFGSAVIPG